MNFMKGNLKSWTILIDLDMEFVMTLELDGVVQRLIFFLHSIANFQSVLF